MEIVRVSLEQFYNEPAEENKPESITGAYKNIYGRWYPRKRTKHQRTREEWKKLGRAVKRGAECATAFIAGSYRVHFFEESETQPLTIRYYKNEAYWSLAQWVRKPDWGYEKVEPTYEALMAKIEEYRQRDLARYNAATKATAH